MTEAKKVTKTREVVSGAIAGAIVLTSIIYWIIQIQSVMELLRLANAP
jgi:hypothetical protein